MKTALTLLILGAIFLAGCNQAGQPTAPGAQACTLEAKVCPDGSSVGRNQAKNCEFDECPVGPARSQAVASGSLRICPDEWVIDRMPKTCDNLSECGPEEYFNVNGTRKEAAEYDVAWIRENCNLSPTMVS